MIKDSKKHPGEKLVMAFAEYTNTYFATEAMDKLQVGGEEGRVRVWEMAGVACAVDCSWVAAGPHAKQCW